MNDLGQWLFFGLVIHGTLTATTPTQSGLGFLILLVLAWALLNAGEEAKP